MKRTLLLCSLIPLAACGAVTHGPTQDFTVLTPGAEHASCMVYNDDFKYEIEGNTTRRIMRSEHPLTVDCYAAGNRQKTITVENEVSNAGYGNVATLGLGAAYDYFDNSLFQYPEEVTVSFLGMDVKSYPMPQHNAIDLPGSSIHGVESMSGTQPMLESDAMKPAPILRKKGWDDPVMDDSSAAFAPSSFTPLPPANNSLTAPVSSTPSSSAALPPNTSGKSADALTRAMNPQVFQ